MAEEIRGLKVKFDADFTEFKKNMKAADSDIKSTQRQLKTLQDTLKLKWDDKKFAKAQQEAQKALEATENKAAILRERFAEMEKVGVTDKTREEYNYLQEEIDKADLSVEKLKKSIEDLDDLKLKNLTSGIDNITSKLDQASTKTKGLSAAAVAVGAGLVAAGLNAVSEADSIATLATQYEMSTTALQRFNYVALQTDTEAETLYKAFTKVRAGIADISAGVASTATTALEKLGLKFDKFKGTEEQFYAIIDSLSNMKDQTQMLSLANDIFGERFATNLLPLIYAGTDAINEYKKEFESTGALTEEQVEELAEFDNVMNKLKKQYENVTLQLGTSFLPVMETVSETLSEDVLPVVRDIADWFGKLDKSEQGALLSLLLLAASISPVLKAFSNITGGISDIIKIVKKLDEQTLTTAGNMLLLALAVGSVFDLVSNWSKLSAVEKVLYSLATAALVAAAAVSMFHASWSVGIAVGAIVAGIAAVMGAINSAKEDLGIENTTVGSISSSGISIPTYDIPTYSTSDNGSITNNDNSYIDNSNVVINIEQNEYMSEDDIIRAVNKGLKQARLARS